ncbi:Putative ER-derived vesicles protein ERV14 [Rhizopus microsporus]|nr:Putative ER-derived vesicles protein ERV14 [Rhizopus microsporus]
MFGPIFLFITAVLLCVILLFLTIFFVIMFSDLECDYINPIDCCNKLNQFVLPEIGLQGFLCFLFLITGHWFPTLINLPVTLHNFKKVRDRVHMYDATEIFRTLSNHKKESFIKLGFYAVVNKLFT